MINQWIQRIIELESILHALKDSYAKRGDLLIRMAAELLIVLDENEQLKRQLAASTLTTKYRWSKFSSSISELESRN